MYTACNNVAALCVFTVRLVNFQPHQYEINVTTLTIKYSSCSSIVMVTQ